jgi:hypothetical protein
MGGQISRRIYSDFPASEKKKRMVEVFIFIIHKANANFPSIPVGEKSSFSLSLFPAGVPNGRHIDASDR